MGWVQAIRMRSPFAAQSLRVRDPVKGRNKVRDMATSAMSAVALTTLVLGVLRPLFDDDVALRLLNIALAAVSSFALWIAAAYVHMTTEKED